MSDRHTPGRARQTARRSAWAPRRGQASVTAVEAGIGVVVLLSVSFAFALGTGGDDRTVQLDAYAQDAATLLSNEPPRHADQTRLAEVVASPSSFDREHDELERRLARILPANVMFRIETEYGTAGYPLPENVPTGEATVATTNGPVTIRVWYA